jgi:integrase
MLTLGLRPSEACGLRWEDIDFAKRELNVNHNLIRPKESAWKLDLPKTPKSIRTIGLYPAMVSALEAQKRSQAEDRLLAGSRWQDNGFVFATRIGTPLHLRELREEWYELRKLAELPSYPMYCTRHTAATRLLAKTRDLLLVAKLLGHTNLTITQKHYAGYLESLTRETADHMTAMYG